LHRQASLVSVGISVREHTQTKGATRLVGKKCIAMYLGMS
jgi:hypothetical protein